MIDGVEVRPRRQILDERGKIMHMLRQDDPWFVDFGEIYFSVVYPGVVKAWHIHKAMTLNYAVVFGAIKLVPSTTATVRPLAARSRNSPSDRTILLAQRPGPISPLPGRSRLDSTATADRDWVRSSKNVWLMAWKPF